MKERRHATDVLDCFAGGLAGLVPIGRGRRAAIARLRLPCKSRAVPSRAYALAPGCCEARRHCFDNAWDGYCQERARWDTFWCKLGTGALYPCTPCGTCDGRGVALEVRLRPAAAACGCQGSCGDSCACGAAVAEALGSERQ